MSNPAPENAPRRKRSKPKTVDVFAFSPAESSGTVMIRDIDSVLRYTKKMAERMAVGESINIEKITLTEAYLSKLPEDS